MAWSRRYIVLGAAALPAGAYWLWRNRRHPEADAILANDPATHAMRRRAIGLLRFGWIPFETEAPMVDPQAPFGSRDPLADLAAVAATSVPFALRALYATAMNALPAFVAAAAPRLAPARYRLDGVETARLRAAGAELAARGWAPGLAHDLGVAADGSVDYTHEHALILSHMRWITNRPDRYEPFAPDDVEGHEDNDTGATYWPARAVNPKRPYGDSTNAEYDMARALGLKMSVDAEGYNHLDPQTVARMTALHLTTPAVLRVLVMHGSADGGQRWQIPTPSPAAGGT